MATADRAMHERYRYVHGIAASGFALSYAVSALYVRAVRSALDMAAQLVAEGS